jgi:ribosomal protein S18 acetylase RimI-like enzyme
MSAAIEIRDYDDADEAALIGLIRQLQAHEGQYYDRMLPPEEIAGWYVDALKQDCRQHAGHIRMACIDGKVEGYCAILTRVEADDVDEIPYWYAYVSELAVAEKARGMGLGKALLADAERLARAAGAKWLRVSVLTRNTLAHEVYRSYGFADRLVNMEKPLT